MRTRAVVRRRKAGGAGARDDAAEEGAGGGDAHLLADHRADGALEDGPGAGDAQAGTALHERGEELVATERAEDGRGIVREVEHAPHGRRHAAHGTAHVQRKCVAGGADGDRRAIRDPRVALVIHLFDAGDGARGEEVAHLRPVVRRAVGQLDLHAAGRRPGVRPNVFLKAAMKALVLL